MLRWGIVGTGDISDKVVSDLVSVAPGAVSGVWGRTRERSDAFAAAHGIPFATDEREALLRRTDIDVLYIATPAATHADIAGFAINARSDARHVAGSCAAVVVVVLQARPR